MSIQFRVYEKQRYKPFFLFEPAPALTKGHRENAEMEKQSFARYGMQNQFSKSILPVFDYLIVLRPTLLFPVWTLVLLGHYHGTAPTSYSLKFEFLAVEIPVYLHVDPRIWVTLCLYSMLAGAVYIINQIADKETDLENNKLYLVADGYVKLPVIKLEAALLFIASIATTVVWFHRSWAYLALIAVSTVLGVIYSVRPFRLKGIPILDLVSNAIGYGGIAFLLGWAATATLNTEALQRAIPYIFCVGAAFVNTTLPDLKGDLAHGDRTTGVVLGVRRGVPIKSISLGHRNTVGVDCQRCSCTYFGIGLRSILRVHEFRAKAPRYYLGNSCRHSCALACCLHAHSALFHIIRRSSAIGSLVLQRSLWHRISWLQSMILHLKTCYGVMVMNKS